MLNKCVESEELDNRFIIEAKTDIVKMEKVINNYIPMVHKIARKMDTSKLAGIDYEDMISIGMNGIHVAVNRYDDNKGNFNTYVYTYIKGLILQELRRYTSVKHGDLNHRQLSIEKLNDYGYSLANMIADGIDYEGMALSTIDDTGWKIVKTNLSPKQFEIVDMRYIKELSSVEIAKQIGCSQQAVLSRIRTIKKRLGSKFTEEELYGYFGLSAS